MIFACSTPFMHHAEALSGCHQQSRPLSLVISFKKSHFRQIRQTRQNKQNRQNRQNRQELSELFTVLWFQIKSGK